MAVRVLLVLAAFAIFYGCGQANSPAERQEQREGVEKTVEDEQPQREQANLPDHDVMMNEDCSAGFPQKCINVATDVTSEEAFMLLTEHFRDENSEYLVVLVTFYGVGQTSDMTGSGYLVRRRGDSALDTLTDAREHGIDFRPSLGGRGGEASHGERGLLGDVDRG
jgi:hypothetical protein